MNILKSILNWISGAAKKVTAALEFGEDAANAVKHYVDSPLLDVVVNLTATNTDNVALAYVRTGLKAFIDAMGWAEKKVSDFDAEYLPHVMNAINAESAYLKAQFDKAGLTRQQAIASAQVIYDPKIVA